jgi:hypothetical protein
MMEPWQHEAYDSTYNGFNYYGGKQYRHICNRRYETVKDSPRLASRKGDIIKFGSGYYKTSLGDWRDWFPQKTDKKKFWRREKSIPNYAMNQYAFIANRYRWIKYKYKNFIDYGAIVMMATGPKPCCARKYYTVRPYRMVSAWPHKKLRSGDINVRMKKPFRIVDNVWFLFDFNLSDFIQNLLQRYGDTERSRDLFLQQIKEVWGTSI